MKDDGELNSDMCRLMELSSKERDAQVEKDQVKMINGLHNAVGEKHDLKAVQEAIVAAGFDIARKEEEKNDDVAKEAEMEEA